MTIHTRTGKPLVKGIIEQLAKLDTMLNLCDSDDDAELFDWLLNGGSDVSLVGRSLVVASLCPQHSTPLNITKDDTRQ